jgi:hypothetical protein
MDYEKIAIRGNVTALLMQEFDFKFNWSQIFPGAVYSEFPRQEE